MQESIPSEEAECFLCAVSSHLVVLLVFFGGVIAHQRIFKGRVLGCAVAHPVRKDLD